MRYLPIMLGILASSGLPMAAATAEELDLKKLIFTKVWNHPDVRPKHVLELNVSNIRVQSSNLVAGSEADNLPDDIKIEAYRAINCTSAPQSRKIDMKLTVDIGDEITLSTTIKSEKSMNFSIAPSIKLATTTLSGTTSQTLDLTSSAKQSYKMSKTEETQEDRQVPPMTAFYIKMYRTVKTISVPFSGPITVDADIKLKYSVGMSYAVLNRDSKNFSDYFPNAADRSFTLKGYVINASASDTEVVYAFEAVDPEDRRFCPPALPDARKSSTASRIPSSRVPPKVTFDRDQAR